MKASLRPSNLFRNKIAHDPETLCELQIDGAGGERTLQVD